MYWPVATGPTPRAFMFTTNNVEPDGSIASPSGYHAVGINPATSSTDPTCAGRASRTTATSLSPAFATYNVDPSGLTARAFGLAPTGASAYGRRSIVRRTEFDEVSITLTESESAFATYSSVPVGLIATALG